MKKIFLALGISSTVLLSSCDTLQQVASAIIPSETEMASGLKEALSKGLFKGFDAFANPNNNALVRFVFPGDAAKIEQTLRDLGMDQLVNNVTQKFTNATSAAVTAAKPIFLNSLKSMSIRDAVGLLVTNNKRAATDYFKTTTTTSLMSAFKPIVDSTVNVQGANKDWQNIATVYNKIPFIGNKLENSPTEFLAARAVDGIFSIVGNEEENIRANLSARNTPSLKKVFGYADSQLQRQSGAN